MLFFSNIAEIDEAVLELLLSDHPCWPSAAVSWLEGPQSLTATPDNAIDGNLYFQGGTSPERSYPHFRNPKLISIGFR